MPMQKTIPASGYLPRPYYPDAPPRGYLSGPMPSVANQWYSQSPNYMDTFNRPVYTNYMRSNPLSAGLQLGLVGAASGMGYAALRRAINMRAGDKDPVPVMKPMLIGALIGGALGMMGSVASQQRGNASYGPYSSWSDLGSSINNNMMYKQQSAAMEKRSAIGIAAILTALFAAMGVYGAQDQGRKSYRAAKAGDKGKAWRHGLAGAGEAVFALPGIGWLGKGIQGLYRGGKGLQAAARGRKLYQGASALRRVGQASNKARYWVPGMALAMAAPYDAVPGAVKPQGTQPAASPATAPAPLAKPSRFAGLAKLVKSKAQAAVKAKPRPKMYIPRF